MLRKAIDEAENQEKQLQKNKLEKDAAESSRLIPPVLPTHNDTVNYGYGTSSSISKGDNDFDGRILYNDDNDITEDRIDDEEESLGADEYWETEKVSDARNPRRRGRDINVNLWSSIKECFMVVINVENVWDSPATTEGYESRRRNHCIILFWFFILATSYTMERVSYKLLVDRSGPFRLLAVEVVMLTHALMVGCGMLILKDSRKEFTTLGIPLIDVGLMALLDTLHMMLVFIAGYHVAPTLTVILAQSILPLTVFISQVAHPNGYFNKCCGRSRISDNNAASLGIYEFNDPQNFVNNTRQPATEGLPIEHYAGSVIIFFAVLLALCPSIYTLIDDEFFTYATTEIPIQTAFNTILFVSSCIPAAVSQLYKEYIFQKYKQPVCPARLNFFLSNFQLLFASVMSPLLYTLLGFAASDDWAELYPSTDLRKNFGQGIKCFFGNLDEEEAKNQFYDEASCDNLLYLVVLYAFSTISVGVAVDKIVNGGGK